MHQLSRYLVIGPIHSGKTSFILNHEEVNASLKPVLTSGLPEIQSLFNENGQVWTTPQSMFIELSGACFYADALVEGLADLVNEYAPFSGIIVVLDAAALTHHTLEEQHLRYDIERFNEILLSLAILLKKPCPTYIVLSQLDRIAGFQVFFKTLNPAQANQSWGFALTNDEQRDKLGAIATHFNQLHRHLAETTLEKLAAISDVECSRLVQQFPNQINYLKSAVIKWLKSFLTVAFQPHQLWLKGIYMIGYSPDYVSTTSLYHPVKSVLKATYPFDECGLQTTAPPSTITQPEHRKRPQIVHYFAAQLFEQFEQNKSSWITRLSKMRALTILKVAAVCIGFISSGAAIVYYYRASMATLTTVRSILIQEKQEDAHQATITAIATRLTQHVQRVHDIDKALKQLHAQRGFPIHKAPLADKLHQLYRHGLHQAIGQDLKAILIEAISDLNQSPEALYRIVKAALMLQEEAQWNTPFLSAQLTYIAEHFLLKPDLKKTFFSYVEQCVQQRTHLSALTVPEYNVMTAAIEAARIRLRTSPPEQLIMFALNSEFVGTGNVHPFRAHARNNAQAIFSTPLGDLTLLPQHTAEHFGAIYEELIPQLVTRWVEGQDEVMRASANPMSAEQVSRIRPLVLKAVRAAWLNTYANAWREQYSQLKFNEMNELNQLAQLFSDLSLPTSALQSFISTVIRHTSWTVLHKQLNNCSQADRTLIQHYLTRHFENLYNLEYRKEQQLYSSFVKQVSLPIQELYQFLKPVLAYHDSDKAAFILTKQRFLYQSQTSDPLTRLFERATILPEPFNRWMTSLAQQSRDLLLKGTQRHLNQVWYETVFKPYETHIHGRYPVFKESQRDASLIDFSAFFGPRGVIMRYVEDYLTPFIDTRATRWQARQKDGGSVQLASSVLTELERAQVIRLLFFGHEHDYPQVHFKLKQMLNDAKLNVTLQYGGCTYYGKESVSTLSDLKWPIWPITDAEDSRNSITIQLQHESGTRLTHTVSGSWAWFRLLDSAHCNREQIPISFTSRINPYTVHYQLWPQQKEHPFIKGIVECFRCPARLTI